MYIDELINEPIPKISFPSIRDYGINTVDEDIIDVKDLANKKGIDNIVIKSKYYAEGIPGSCKSIYVRETVENKLLSVAKKLKELGNYDLVLYDGWRPFVVQYRLYIKYYNEIKFQHPEYDEEELHKRTAFFVSKPSQDEKHPFLHNTGGAIDLTIAKDGKELNMGTEFDDFSDRAWTNHFEDYEIDEEVRNNRRLLYNIMLKEGFTNLPSEWWHYDYGDKFWAYFTDNTAIYEGRLVMDVPCFALI